MVLDPDVPPADERAPVRWGMGDALLGNGLILWVSALVGTWTVVALGWDADEERSLTEIAVLQVPVWVGLLGAPLWATYLKGRRSLRADFGLAMRWTDVPLGLVAGVVGQIALGLVITALYSLLGLDVERVGQSAEELTAAADDPVGVVLLVLVVVVAAPVLEELFYRGLWLRSAERRFGTAWAVVLTSVLFGAIHFQPYDLPALVGIGAIFALLTVRTGRLGPAIWAHVSFNAVTVTSLLTSG